MVNLKQLEDNIKTFDDIVENLDSFDTIQDSLNHLVSLNEKIQKDLKSQQQGINSEKEILMKSSRIL